MMVNSKVRRPIRIYLAVDGSEHSLAALQLLRDLPINQSRQAGSTITALAVLTIRHTSSRADLLAALDQAQANLQGIGAEVNTGLLYGHPAQAMAEFAEEREPDLIVMGAKGLRATLGILLGGVAQQMVEYSRWPVLVVRLPYHALNRILLVTDGSPCSQCAVKYILEFPLNERCIVDVMHVLPPSPRMDRILQTWPIGTEVPAFPPTENYEEAVKLQMEQEETEGREILSQAIQVLQGSGINASPLLVRGDAATEIIEYAKENQVDLIVAGSRGLSQVRGWLLGSVSRKLVHYAPCSVMIVKGRRECEDET
jgi:nucleotide-binding universal stress UspA family protein